MSKEPITAYSAPDYDEWGWDTYWSAEDWMDYHKALVGEYGKKDGNRRFVEAWHAGPSFMVARANYLSFKPVFINYMEKQGIYNALNDGIAKLVTDSTRVVAETPGAVIATAQNTVKVIRWLIPALVLIALVVAFVFVRSKYKLIAA